MAIFSKLTDLIQNNLACFQIALSIPATSNVYLLRARSGAASLALDGDFIASSTIFKCHTLSDVILHTIMPQEYARVHNFMRVK